MDDDGNKVLFAVSPSSRRAWIEIQVVAVPCAQSSVALLAEGVDRNHYLMAVMMDDPTVALLAEGVDRNSLSTMFSTNWTRRPPRGGRG